ncbi:FAD-dependent oxidoreductase [Paractinoplanes lichenicola]|uniref:FAD-dependent oxidoreductase n=1 Tax=Paractinoplanes lichenicola TaxID=2802976 RepID=A0ABS1VDJ8_9ACTN|nr:cyclic nucleotide-binding domain-containing thioredoxin-disulfide reductase [Actinoplanes lichenicola]MBL7252752.1 FAD-dependent oxidoreductase [Actinoplanes lichenicola]
MSQEAGPGLGDEQFGRLAAYGESEHVEAGRHLYEAGDNAYDFFLLGTAAVDIVRDATVAEPERLVYRAGPGDFLGELSLLTGQHVYLTARVIKSGTIVRIGAAALRRVIAEHADLGDVLIEAFRVRRDFIRTVAGGALELAGRPDAVESLTLRTYVNQLLLPHTWRDATGDDLPVAIVNGRTIRRATPGSVAEALGLTYRPGGDPPDLVVVGAGPAGLAAAVYAASEGLSTVLLDRSGLGGQAAKSARIENYLGFPQGISGEHLTRLAMAQALKFGVRIHAPCPVEGLHKRAVLLADGTRIEARAVLAATGAHYRRLDLARWAEFERSGGIRYAATELDVRACAAQPVAVVGGANSAGQAALSLAGHDATVDLIIRGPRLEAGMSSYLTERIHHHPRIRLHTETTVRELGGEHALDSIVVERAAYGKQRLDCRALFCFIGADPASGWLTGVDKDAAGFVRTDGALPYLTSVPGVFAVGDLRSGSTKRVATAVGEGAAAVSSIHSVLNR